MHQETPVEKLAELLLTNLHQEDLEPELNKYKGEYSDKVLEFCIENDPFEILSKLFGLPHLRRIAKVLNLQVSNNMTKDDLIKVILTKIGFKIPPPLFSIHAGKKNAFVSFTLNTKAFGISFTPVSEIILPYSSIIVIFTGHKDIITLFLG